MLEFDNIISLGYNCEVSFRIKDHYKKVNSTIYSWAYVEDRGGFIRSMGELQQLADSEKKLLPHGMFNSAEYGIAFHSVIHKEELFNDDGTENQAKVKEALEEMKGRYTYLAKKLLGMYCSKTKKTLYVCKLQKWETDIEKNKAFIEELAGKLSEVCVPRNHTLLMVLEETPDNEKLKSLENEELLIRYIDNYAEDDETMTGGDQAGWNRVFDEFALIQGEKV